MTEEQQNIPGKSPKRPQLLSILCILTFIGSGFGVFGFLMVAINFEATIEALKVLYAKMPEANFILEAPRDFFLVSFLLSAFSLLGAVMMWNLRKIGFHIYTSSQLIYLCLLYTSPSPRD